MLVALLGFFLAPGARELKSYYQDVISVLSRGEELYPSACSCPFANLPLDVIILCCKCGDIVVRTSQSTRMPLVYPDGPGLCCHMGYSSLYTELYISLW